VTSVDSTSRVSCIVLNWNGWNDTVRCLAAIKESAFRNLQVIVVDNKSTDDSVEQIKTAHPDTLVIEAAANLGFAGGNNLGIRHALADGADYIWLLNNDTLPTPEALSELVEKAVSDLGIGAVASVSYYCDSPSRVEAWAGAQVNLWIGYGRNSTEPRPDNWFHSLNGTSLLISRACLKDAGLLDEGFFLYWEDTEFCLRLRKRGWRIAAAPKSVVFHRVNGSTGGNKVILDRFQTASGLRLLRLHSPAPRLASLLFLAIRFSRRIARLEFRRCRSVWDGVQDYLHSLPVAQRIR
jgi:GT2 family glycosyltransferase